MKEIFLSASVPIKGRGDYYKTSDPYLIQCAVKELAAFALLNDYRLVWGGHPSITPMIESICQDMGYEYEDRVLIYQSEFFRSGFPEENKQFKNIIYTRQAKSRIKSLLFMRKAMLSRENLVGAIFIGGMDGVEEEYKLFSNFHPNKLVIAIGSTGGAAKTLATKLYRKDNSLNSSVRFYKIFSDSL